MELITQPPGYTMRVDPEEIDLHIFRRLMAEGQSRLAAGAPKEAASTLREALALWRGPVLADVVESGITWPELASLQKARLDAKEDYFQAELECGEHHPVLRELEVFVESEPLRERAAAQLMVALYRCGRQADALGVYNRVRSALVEELGLEPGPELQQLQQRILTHDRKLEAPSVNPQVEIVTRPEAPAGAIPLEATPAAVRPAIVEQWSVSPLALASAAAPATDPVATAGEELAGLRRGRGGLVSKRQHISVLLVSAESGAVAHEARDRAAEEISPHVWEKIESFGGTVVSAIGSISLGLFNRSPDREVNAELTVHTATAIRSLLGAAGAWTPAAPAASAEPAVRVAVASGEAVLWYAPDDLSVPSLVTGSLMDECHDLLSRIPPGDLRVCATTHRLTRSRIAYQVVGGAASGWQVRQDPWAAAEIHDAAPSPATNFDIELNVLRGLLERTRQRSTPHFVTLLGEHDITNHWILERLRQFIIEQSPGSTRVLFTTVEPATRNNPLSSLAGILASYCGILPHEPSEVALYKLAATIRGLVDSEDVALRLLARLSVFVAPEQYPLHEIDVEEIFDSWRKFLRTAARRHPVVVVLRDLHRADESLLRLIETLPSEMGSVPLLVIVGARRELLKRRPEWSGGKDHATTICLMAGELCQISA
ncbi:BTAD domain-containing putative transcriptional regulator [Actinomadura sp. 3N508]|uniref:BTAD domain-containing putative transcriptional regulator n=1 Tax=Actinomadura sp. 3N508 TaxID=3375153 RepID=UPI00378D2F20